MANHITSAANVTSSIKITEVLTATTAAPARNKPSLEMSRDTSSAYPSYRKMVAGILDPRSTNLQKEESFNQLHSYYADQAATLRKFADDSTAVLREEAQTPNGRKGNNMWVARQRYVATITEKMYSQLGKIRIQAQHNKSLQQEMYDVVDMLPYISSGIRERGIFEKLTRRDQLELLMGAPTPGNSNGQRRYGIKNFSYANYVFIRPEDDGHVLCLNGQEYPVTGETIYNLIMSVDENRYQDVAYDEAGIFPSWGQSASVNGITFTVDPGQIILATGDILEHDKIRVSLPFKLYRALGLAMAYGQDPEEYPGYKMLNDVVVDIFGDTKHFPANRFEVEQVHGVGQAVCKKNAETGTYEPTSDNDREAQFKPRGYIGIRGLDADTMYNPELFRQAEIDMAKAYQERQEANVKRNAERRAERQAATANTSAPKPTAAVVNSTPRKPLTQSQKAMLGNAMGDDLEEKDDHPF